MGLVVQKFGSTSVTDTEEFHNVTRVITGTCKTGNQVVAVSSAQGDATSDLIEKTEETNPSTSNQEMDMLLSTGEQISIPLYAMAIEALGYPVVSSTGWQAGMMTNTVSMNTRIKEMDAERIKTELSQRKIVIVTGLQGVSRNKNITVLGRGGFDTSTMALTASLDADLCQIYTDVNGVYAVDPGAIKGTRELEEVTYNEVLELAIPGTRVLYDRSMEMAKKYDIKLEVLSSFMDHPGIKIKGVIKRMEESYISSAAKDKDISRIALIGVPNEIGTSFEVLSLLAQHYIDVDIILQGIGRKEGKGICFAVAGPDLERVTTLLKEYREKIRYGRLETNSGIAKVPMVGMDMANNPGVVAKLFEALYDTSININMIFANEIKVSIPVDGRGAEKAVQIIHDKFFLAT